MQRVFRLFGLCSALALAACASSEAPSEGTDAQIVSQETALSTAVNWLKVKYPQRTDFTVQDISVQSEDGLATAYRIEFSAGGFVIVSAKPDARPIIGYSNLSPLSGADPFLEDYINKTSLTETSDNGWFESILEHGPAGGKKDGVGNNIVVEPMLQSKWGQSGGSNPNFTYNNMTPYVTERQRAPVGCTAVALGQVLKYYNYPKVGQLSNNYCTSGSTVYNCWDGEIVETAFDTKYAWDKMPLSLNYASPRESVDAVAKLLLDIGRSTEVVYGEHGSNVQLENPKIFASFRKHFRLPDIEMHKRSDFTQEDWEALIKNELTNHRPVVFSGYDSGVQAGHAYVLDGLEINGEQLFPHVNWGWGGSANGFFDISTLVIDGRYSFTEDLIAIINFTPNTVEEKGSCNGPAGLRCQEGLVCAANGQTSAPIDEPTSDEFGTCMAEGAEPDEPPVELEVVVEDFTANVAKGEWAYFGPFESSQGLEAKMTGSGDADLYVKIGEQPSSSVHDCRPYKSGSDETCTFEEPATYYVAVNGYADASEVALTVTTYRLPETSP